MRYGIISDIHANLEGLQVALDVLDEEGVDQLICLGDVIGYNASPKECFQTVERLTDLCLKGNHERYLIGQVPKGVRQATLDVIDWTRDQLTNGQIDTIRELPDYELHDEILWVHGSPRDPDEYILTNEAIQGNMAHMREQYVGVPLCFFGHSHIPMVIGAGDVDTDFKATRTVQLDRSKTYLINCGSVGQPRDGCPLSGFGLLDTDDWAITIYRKEYDVVRTQQRIMEAGLDRRLAMRLGHGK